MGLEGFKLLAKRPKNIAEIEWVHNCEVAFEELEEELKTQSQVSNVLADEPVKTNEIKNEIEGEIKEMTNEMKVFNFKENEVRTVVKDDEIWFVAKDVCGILGIGNPSATLKRLSETMKGINSINTIQGAQEVLVINEPGVYKLAFTSRKKEADEFTDWLAIDVIPSIRKHGAYMTPATLDEFIANPNFGIKLLTSLQEEREARKALELQSAQQQKVISELEPKASHYDQWINIFFCLSLNL